MVWEKFTRFHYGGGKPPVQWISLSKTGIYISAQAYRLLQQPQRVYLYYDEKHYALKLQKTENLDGFKLYQVGKCYSIPNTRLHTIMPIGRYHKYRFYQGWIFQQDEG